MNWLNERLIGSANSNDSSKMIVCKYLGKVYRVLLNFLLSLQLKEKDYEFMNRLTHLMKSTK